MKRKKRKTILVLVFIVIVILGLIQLRKNVESQDDIIFFQLFSRGKTKIEQGVKEEAENIYLKVDYENINFKNVKLLDTKNNIYRKIAPGSER